VVMFVICVVFLATFCFLVALFEKESEVRCILLSWFCEDNTKKRESNINWPNAQHNRSKTFKFPNISKIKHKKSVNRVISEKTNDSQTIK
jgi:hypothetical protein